MFIDSNEPEIFIFQGECPVIKDTSKRQAPDNILFDENDIDSDFLVILIL
jgi:hypothetical protein